MRAMKANITISMILLFGNNGCRSTSPESHSDLRHLEGDVIHHAPAFMWHRVPEDELQQFISDQVNGRKIIPQNSPMTLRLQEIVDSLDEAARKLKPNEMKKVPRPVAVVLDDESLNAFVTTRGLCVKQWVKKAGAPDLDPTTIPVDPNASIRVIDMSNPGEVHEIALSPTPSSSDPDMGEDSSNCKVVEPDTIGWNLPKFVEMYNSKLPPDKQQCRLSVSHSKVIVPTAEGCGTINSDYVGTLRFDAQANIVFLPSKLHETRAIASSAACTTV